MRTLKTLLLLAGSLCLAATTFAQTPTAAASADPFPPVDPKFFDAASPTAADVDTFLKAIWGYDTNRSWRVEAIQKTMAPGVAKVTVFLADKSQGNKVEPLRFFVTPDGKYAIADTIFRFGPRPFDDVAETLRKEADGPAQGSASRSFEIIEFADLQCPHCKEAVPVMESIKKDFPQARVVYQNYPLVQIHPFAFKAAAYGNCVATAKGDAAFYTYAHDVFDHQESLTDTLADQTLNDAATKAGTQPAAIAACAATPATKAKVQSQIDLAEKIGVDQTPMLAVNGHLIPMGGLPYDTLKQIIEWDMKNTK
jgi:protein-disulfide isomerase